MCWRWTKLNCVWLHYEELEKHQKHYRPQIKPITSTGSSINTSHTCKTTSISRTRDVKHMYCKKQRLRANCGKGVCSRSLMMPRDIPTQMPSVMIDDFINSSVSVWDISSTGLRLSSWKRREIRTRPWRSRGKLGILARVTEFPWLTPLGKHH